MAARLVNSRSGRTSRPGDPRPDPQGAGCSDSDVALLTEQPVEVYGRCDPCLHEDPGQED